MSAWNLTFLLIVGALAMGIATLYVLDLIPFVRVVRLHDDGDGADDGRGAPGGTVGDERRGVGAPSVVGDSPLRPRPAADPSPFAVTAQVAGMDEARARVRTLPIPPGWLESLSSSDQRVIAQAEALMAEGRFREAHEQIEGALGRDTLRMSAPAWRFVRGKLAYLWGEESARLRLYPVALAQFQRARTLYPDLAALYVPLAEVLWRMGRAEAAEAAAREAYLRAPGLGNPLPLYLTLLRVNDRHVVAKRMLRTLPAALEKDEAVVRLREWLESRGIAQRPVPFGVGGVKVDLKSDPEKLAYQGVGIPTREALDRAGRAFGVAAPQDVPLNFRKHEEFSDWVRFPHWPRAIATGTITLPLRKLVPEHPALADVLAHEAAGVVIHRLSGGKGPQWLLLGLCATHVEEETGRLPVGGFHNLPPLYNEWELAVDFSTFDEMAFAHAQLQSWAMTRVLIDRDGRDAVVAFLRDIARGRAWNDAWREHFSLGRDEVVREVVRRFGGTFTLRRPDR